MTEDEIIAFVAALPDVDVLTASADSGAPQAAWGDTFFSATGVPADRSFPFATIVVSDYEGFDAYSQLNRPGVFRLNIAVGRRVFQELFGYGPEAFAAHAGEYDFTAADQLFPHPVYAVQGWASIVNPGEQTSDRAQALLVAARERSTR